MIRIVFLLLALLSLQINKAVGQVESFGEYIPPSPNAASFGKYIESPISIYQGTPNISLDVYKIDLPGFSFPITLSYHSSGFRVEEISSNVGLGWSLNCSGLITRTIRGLRDNGNYQTYIGNNHPVAALDPSYQADYALLNKLSSGNVDSQPDLFTFSFNGETGKFVKTDGIQVMSQKPYKIVAPENDNGTWLIIDDKGNKYLFSDTEISYNRALTVASANVTSWMLSKIITANDRDTISFEYIDTEFEQDTEITWSKFYKAAFNNTYEFLNEDRNLMVTRMYAKEISKIRYRNGTIDFFYGDRIDIAKGGNPSASGGKRIDKILVKDFMGNIVR